MLPIDERWYRRLLGYAFPIGLAAGVLALLYIAVTETGSGLFFDDAGTDWWSGEWWWIPLIAAGGLAVATLRRWLAVPEEVPGAIAFAQQAWVDPASGPRLVLLSAVSLVVGASLGPSFGLILMGGALGSWIVSRMGVDEDEAKHEYALTGMAGGLGSAFSAPLFAVVLTTELSPTEKGRYVAAFIPQLIAATLGFVVFFGVTSRTLLDAYQVPPYTFDFVDLLVGLVLGVFAAVTLGAVMVINVAVVRAAALVTSPLLRGLIGGALVGLIAVALPLTLTSGSAQLGTVIQNATVFTVGFVAAVLVAKILAVSLSLSAGFLGGNVFPMIFIGGTAGVLVHLLIPDIPLSLSVAAMMAAVPGAFLNAPLSLTLIAAATVGLDALAVIPVTVAVVTAYLFISVVRYLAARRSEASAPT